MLQQQEKRESNLQSSTKTITDTTFIPSLSLFPLAPSCVFILLSDCDSVTQFQLQCLFYRQLRLSFSMIIQFIFCHRQHLTEVDRLAQGKDELKKL